MSSSCNEGKKKDDIVMGIRKIQSVWLQFNVQTIVIDKIVSIITELFRKTEKYKSNMI